MTQEQIQRFLHINVALSAEQDREQLLTNILDAGIDMTNCDGGTLYLLEEDGLHFCRMVTRSMGIRQGGHEDPIMLPPVPLRPSHVCSRAVLENRLINVENVRDNQEFDFSGARRYDEMTGYHTRSMLVVPLANEQRELIGVLQLLNCFGEDGEVIPFPEEMELPVLGVACQAAVSLTNMQYSEQIHKLLDSLVGALSTAIDQRTPYNANHTRNMAKYAQNFLDWLDRVEHPWKFDAQRKRSFLLSVWLHDVGKLTVPLAVMDKDSRLGKAIQDVEHRFTVMGLLNRIALLEGRISPEQAAVEQTRLDDALALIRKVDRARFLPDDLLQQVQALSQNTYVDEQGETKPWLTEDELIALSVRKGTLTAKEREIMESHVVMTARILDQVFFPKAYHQVPQWAAAHHELLHGQGYPSHLAGADIPKEVRLLTVLDIFDALTARDRPYKPGMPIEKALSILNSMVNEGSLDEEIVALFAQSRAWEEES